MVASWEGEGEMKGVHVVVVVVVVVEDQRGPDGLTGWSSWRQGQRMGHGVHDPLPGLPTWRDHSRLTNPTERRAARAAPTRRLSTGSPRHSSSGFLIHRTEGPFSSLLPNIWRASFSSAFQATTTDRRPRTSNPAAHRDSHPLLPPVAPGPDPRELPSIHPPVAHLPSVLAHDRRLGCGPSKPRRKKANTCVPKPPIGVYACGPHLPRRPSAELRTLSLPGAGGSP